MTQSTQSAFTALTGHQYMNLTTYRKSGEPMVTPVWFAQDGEKLYLFTTANAGKVKRIRNNPRVQVGPCDRAGKPLGESVSATARVLAPAEAERANQVLAKKYGLMKRIFDFFGKLRGMGERAYIEVTP